MSSPAPSSTKTIQFARFVVRRRVPIAGLLVAVSLIFAYPIANALFTALGRPLPGPALRISVSASDLFPDHPFIRVQEKFANFGAAELPGKRATGRTARRLLRLGYDLLSYRTKSRESVWVQDMRTYTPPK